MRQPDALASKGRAVEEWTDVHFFRPLGLRIAGAAAGTRVTADQITLASLIVGLAAGHLFVYPTLGPNLLGLGLFIISDVLDSADGQLARLRGTSTRMGRILDGASDSVRFINLYVHLGVRLMVAGGGQLVPLLVMAALVSHSHQSSAVDFIKNAYLRFFSRLHDALDLPGEPGSAGTAGSAAGRVTQHVFQRLYRQYIERQASMFRQTVRLARRLGPGDLSEADRVRWAELQGPVVARTAWIGQNIRFGMLGATAVVGWPMGFLWVTCVPLNLVLLFLLLRHEHNSRHILRSLGTSRGSAPHPYRGALIGLGGIARNGHLPAFRSDTRVNHRLSIVAGVDSRDVEPVDGVRLLRSPAGLSGVQPLDFVDICTPTVSHLPLALWALRAGYHVICEKPVAVTRAEAAQVVRAARDAGRVVFPCHQYRFNPVWQRIRAWVESGSIGRWHLAELSVHRPEADRGSQALPMPWRVSQQQAGGGVLLDHGTHLLYAFMDVAGLPVAVQSWTGRLRHRSYQVEDSAQVILEYPGAMATILLTWAGHRRENHIRIIGDQGMIQWDGGALTLDRGGTVESADLSAQMDKASYVHWFGGLFAEFARAMDERDGAQHLADITQVAAVLEAAYTSARLSRPRFVSIG